MNEALQPPDELTANSIIKTFRSLADLYGPIDPSELPDDNQDVANAHELYYKWQKQEESKLSDGNSRSRTEYEFQLTTMFVDAGFSDPSYVADVANDWLVQTLAEAEETEQFELALKIKIKMFELNKILPAELREPATEVGAALEDTLSIEDCAELATMETIEESLGYAFTLLIESGAEDPEDLLRAKGILE